MLPNAWKTLIFHLTMRSLCARIDAANLFIYKTSFRLVIYAMIGISERLMISSILQEKCDYLHSLWRR